MTISFLAVFHEVERQHDGEDERFGRAVENQRFVLPLPHRRSRGVIEQAVCRAQYLDVDDAAVPVDVRFEDHHTADTGGDSDVGIDRIDFAHQRRRLNLAADAHWRPRRRWQRRRRSRNIACQPTDDASGDAARYATLDTSGDADVALIVRPFRLDGGRWFNRGGAWRRYRFGRRRRRRFHRLRWGWRWRRWRRR